MKMENKNRKGVYIGNNNGTIQSQFPGEFPAFIGYGSRTGIYISIHRKPFVKPPYPGEFFQRQPLLIVFSSQ